MIQHSLGDTLQPRYNPVVNPIHPTPLYSALLSRSNSHSRQNHPSMHEPCFKRSDTFEVDSLHSLQPMTSPTHDVKPVVAAATMMTSLPDVNGDTTYRPAMSNGFLADYAVPPRFPATTLATSLAVPPTSNGEQLWISVDCDATPNDVTRLEEFTIKITITSGIT